MVTANVVLVCSRNEAFGRVTVEGMLAGRPVVGARCAATAELIEDGVNGFLYAHGNAKDLAEKIHFLYDHPDIANDTGSTAQAWADKTFSKERYRADLAALFPIDCDAA